MKTLGVLCGFLVCTAVSGQSVVELPPSCVEVRSDDSDRDGLADACELELAQTFAPILIVRVGGCNWDSDLSRLGGGYRFAVQQQGAVIRLVYMPAYFRDCGWSGPKCRLPGVDCAPHAGDSEFIAIDVEERDGRLSVAGVFLSAHCFGRSATSCRWYRGSALEVFRWDGSAALVWVAEGRQANYPSWTRCNEGHYFIDTCRRHDAAYRFPVVSSANVGSRARHGRTGGCVAAGSIGSARVHPRGVECFWDDDHPFRGWQNAGPGVTSYSRYLREFGGFQAGSHSYRAADELRHERGAS